MSFPKKIFVTHDPNADSGNDLLAWPSLESTDNGKVGIYVLESELDKRTTAEIRRKGSRKWGKP